MPALKIQIATVGKLKEQYWKQACDEYLKRLKAYAQVRVIELDDVDPARAGGVSQARAKEAANLIKALEASTNQSHVFTIALDIEGNPTSSEQLAELVLDLTVNNTSTIVFIIGGPNGIDKQLLNSVDLRISFGPITLPHNLALVVLCEQLYRSFKINHREPYHK
jgi:23S rRNA (pseudouridine1915-N3)-methyltransferase